MDTQNDAAGADLLAPVQSNQAAAREEPQTQAPKQVSPAEAAANAEAADRAKPAAKPAAKGKASKAAAAKAAETGFEDRKGYVYGQMLTSRISDANGQPIARRRFVQAADKRAQAMVSAGQMAVVPADEVNADRGPVVVLEDQD